MVLRDIDDEEAGTTNRNLVYTSVITETPLQLARTAQLMSRGAGFIYHCSEGQPGSVVAREFTDVANAGCLEKKLVAIHCNAVADSDWQRWQAAEAGAVVWSPSPISGSTDRQRTFPQPVSREYQSVSVPIGVHRGPSTSWERLK
jgi:cytosine/adenosine deaminase-related metal-dependent hydrolase